MSGQVQATKPKTRGRPCQISKTTRIDTDWFVADKKTELDPCDCVDDNCLGCWYPCEKCGSNKCSAFCRRSRKESQWQQQHIEWMSTQ